MNDATKHSGPVDVLAEMQADIDALEQRVLAGEFTLSRGYDKVNRLRSIHAALAELIEAVSAQQTGGFCCQCSRCTRVRAALAAATGEKS